jgi:hypothetical protein
MSPYAMAGEKADAAQPSAADLSLEVQALETLYYFKATPRQMKWLRTFAKETAQAKKERKGQVSEELREALVALRTALVEGLDEDEIDLLDQQRDSLRDSENPQLDDDVDITEAARKRVPEVLRRLKAYQVADFLGEVADELPDPLERLVTALDSVRRLKPKDWPEKRNEIAEEVSMLVMGLDVKKAAEVNNRVLVLLTRARGLTDAEFKKQQAELEKNARQIVGEVGPLEVVRHYTEHALAELLSNPRLAAAIDARLK